MYTKTVFREVFNTLLVAQNSFLRALKARNLAILQVVVGR